MLVGTQMVTKGHHFPGVTLVGVSTPTRACSARDFRAAERLAQTIVQVAGRAGRGERAGEVLIQTEYPEHPLLQRLVHGGYEAFAAGALAERAAARWPPFSRLALLRASARGPTAAALRFLCAARASAPAPRLARAAARAGAGAHGAARRPAPRAAADRARRTRARYCTVFCNGWLPRDRAPAGSAAGALGARRRPAGHPVARVFSVDCATLSCKADRIES